MVLLDDLPADAEPETAAAVAVLVRLFGGVKWFKNQPQLIRRDADAGVAHADLGHVRAPILPQLETELAAARHCLAGVDDQVQEDLLNLPGHDESLRSVMEKFLDLHAVLGQVFLGENQDFVHKLGQVALLTAMRLVACKTEHTADNGRAR